MDHSKAIGLNGILIEVWKNLEEKSTFWLTKLFNEILNSNKCQRKGRKALWILYTKIREIVRTMPTARRYNL